MSVLSLLRRSTGKVVDYRVATRGQQRPAHPRIFTAIAVEHTIRGSGLTAGEVERAVTLAATRYCPAAAMLGEVADMVETWVLIDDETGDVVGRSK
jgi:putative redox protein